MARNVSPMRMALLPRGEAAGLLCSLGWWNTLQKTISFLLMSGSHVVNTVADLLVTRIHGDHASETFLIGQCRFHGGLEGLHQQSGFRFETFDPAAHLFR